MVCYLSHFSAAAYWNIPHIEIVFGSEIPDTEAIDFTVFKSSERYRIKDGKVHVCEIDLPENAIVSKDGNMIASPELVFLQLASKLSIHRLILLGLQLCSHPPGKHNEALTTKKKLKDFLTKSSGHHGRRKAMRALKYVENGSASIMESLAHMILGLPYVLGGYGLSGAVFNYEITLKNDGRKNLGQNRCYVDLFYKHAKVAIEYESFAHHSSPTEQGRDIMRADFLERQGIHVMRFSTIQLYNIYACKNFSSNVASRLGKRIQIRTNKFEEMHTLLRELLPKRKAVYERCTDLNQTDSDIPAS